MIAQSWWRSLVAGIRPALRSGVASKSTLVSVLSLVGGQASAAVISLVAGVLQARFIEPSTLGYFATFGILTAYLQVLQSGWLTTLRREYPYWHGKGSPADAARVLAVANGLVVLLCAVVALVFGSLAAVSLVQGNSAAAAGWLVQIVLAASSYYMLMLGCTYRSSRDFTVSSRVTVLTSVLSLAAVPLVALFGFWGLCLRAAIPAASSSYVLHAVRPAKVHPVFAPRDWWRLIRFGLPMDAAGYLATAAVGATMIAIVAREHGTAVLGLFAFARVAEGVIGQMSMTVTGLFVPRINYRMGLSGNLRECASYSTKAALALVTLVGLAVAVAVLACVPAVRLLTPKYTDSLPIMQVLMWGGLSPVFLLPTHVLIAARRRRPVIAIYVTSFASFAALAGLCVWFDLPPVYLAGAYVAAKVIAGVVAHGVMWAVARAPAPAVQLQGVPRL